MAVAGLAIGYISILLWLILITPILGVAISKLGNTTAIDKSMRVQADVQAIKTQLQLYESMKAFFRRQSKGWEPWLPNLKAIPGPLAGISYSRNCQKIPGAATTSIAILV